MSFIVSYNGQFRPYKLPDLSHYDRIHHTYAAKKNKKLEDHEDDDFEVELGAAQLKSKELNKKLTAIGSYEKVDKFHQQNKVPYLARHLMSTPVDCLKDTDTLGTLLKHMQKYGYRHFPVVDEKSSLVGIVSDRDVIRVINKEKSTKLSEFMSKEVLTALDSTRIQDIAKIMLHEKINCLPIITDDHVIVGIITQTNILNYVIQSYPLAASS
jgi:CBS domain-containing protein